MLYNPRQSSGRSPKPLLGPHNLTTAYAAYQILRPTFGSPSGNLSQLDHQATKSASFFFGCAPHQEIVINGPFFF
jgi:hypothetical protein